MKTEEAKALRRFCGAILEYRNVQPYKSQIKRACEVIYDPDASEKFNRELSEAIISNIINQRANPYSTLKRKYGLTVSYNEFGAIKSRFINELARLCGFPSGLGNDGDFPFSKRDILAMLFAIADEANGCIVKDGAFNHQVAGVALKAIDQVVRLSGLCESAPTDDANGISMDVPSDNLGA